MQHTDSPARGARRRFTAAGVTFALVTGGLFAATFGPTLATYAADDGRTVDGRPAAGAPDRPGTLSGVQNAAYASFTDCSALLDYYRTHARPIVGPYGLPGNQFGVMFDTVGGVATAARAAGGAPVPAAAPNAAAEGTTSATGTNVQVAGVDEADVAKRVGDLVYSAAPGTVDWSKDPNGSSLAALTVARTRDGRSEVLGRLRLDGWTAQSMLVDGTTVLLVGGAPWKEGDIVAPGPARIMPGYGFANRTRVVQVDVSDPASPRVVRSLVVDGSSVGTRLVDGVARITVSGATNRLKFVQPLYPDQGGIVPPLADGGPDAPVVSPPYDEGAVKKAEKKATAANRQVVARSTIDAWLPTYELTEGTGARPTSTGSLLSCQDVSAPKTFSGLDTMSMLTFDLRDTAGISRWDAAGVVASGAQLYATADRTYVATTPWQDWAVMSPTKQLVAMRSQRSQIHLFDTTGGASPVYVGSGEVPGFLLNQFSMDENGGYLRVASTTMPDWWGGDRERTPSTSQVTVLRIGEDGLTRTGSVGGLGKTETIRAVRFLGDVGYVVTYRQTDPLYTIDLSDPTAPRVAGELKILGYSAYLHPVGDGLVLGVGQDATAKGVTTGLQMALFDVSDPAQPRRVDTVNMPGAWSDVEGDHHAFTFADGLALVPYTRWIDPGAPVAPSDDTVGAVAPGQQGFDAGVVAVRMTGTGAGSRFTEPVVLRPIGSGPQAVDPTTGETGPAPLRTFVGDGSVWTVTTGGIAAHDARTLARTDFTRF
ncbi:beta-propeller domain-containing protein [Kineosporia sp. R_H_3]|uniref:beta-propeller domain-containing protein n=1 Tax=Kineosporia sp. R_H_3 TaxID=1961848 RepID=UPI000B4BF729|nr:beta-propeller domain-containing protein [Kineosporia sp. R_H_3]